MNRVDSETLIRLQQLLLNLLTTLENESEKNWTRAIKLMLIKIDSALSGKANQKEIINYVSATFKSINAGNGSFSDFFIWKDNFDERKKTNAELQKIKNDLWDLIE